MELSTVKITTSAGVLIRKLFIKELKRYCWRTDVEVAIEEDKYLFDSDFRITLRGDRKYLEEISDWILRLNH